MKSPMLMESAATSLRGDCLDRSDSGVRSFRGASVQGVVSKLRSEPRVQPVKGVRLRPELLVTATYDLDAGSQCDAALKELESGNETQALRDTFGSTAVNGCTC